MCRRLRTGLLFRCAGVYLTDTASSTRSSTTLPGTRRRDLTVGKHPTPDRARPINAHKPRASLTQTQHSCELCAPPPPPPPSLGTHTRTPHSHRSPVVDVVAQAGLIQAPNHLMRGTSCEVTAHSESEYDLVTASLELQRELGRRPRSILRCNERKVWARLPSPVASGDACTLVSLS